MAQRFHRDVSPDLVEDEIGANSVQFSVGDPVYKNTSGFLALGVAGSRMIGWCLENKTVTSDNQTVKKHRVQYVPAYPFIKMVLPGDIVCTQAKVGSFCNFATIATGACTVDITNAAGGGTNQLCIRDFDPNRDGTTTDVVVSASETQFLGFALSVATLNPTT